MPEFYSVDGELKISEAQHQKAVALCKQASKEASLAWMEAWSTTSFRDDLALLYPRRRRRLVAVRKLSPTHQ